MSGVLTILLAALSQFATVAGSSQIVSIINALTSIIPFLIKEYQALVPIVTGIIDALRNNEAITPEQEAALDDLEAAVAAYGPPPPTS
jgi:hypothetical protein